MNLDFGLTKTDRLLRKFEDIHNFIYANDGLSTQQTLEEFIKILFIKVVDEKKKEKQFYIDNEEYEKVKSSKLSGKLLERINILFLNTTQEYSDLFDKGDKIKLSPLSLANTIYKLQDYSLTSSSNDVKGLAFQKFLSHQEKDSRGQFFTPEPIIDFCVKIIQPGPNETIIDPACGSGGFLNSSFNYIINNYDNVNIEKVVSMNLYGFDINKSIARIAKMKLLLEANVETNIKCINSLIDYDELVFNANLKKASRGFDIVLTNPPFGTAGKISDKKILSSYDLGYKWKKISDYEFVKTNLLHAGQAAEILFIERCIDLLKEGGRMGIVLPNGHFENPSLEYLRYYIKQRTKILGIVNLPQETFIPYGTGVKTSLLFVQKETPNIYREYPLFFSRIRKIGYQGNKNGSPMYKKDDFGNILRDENKNPIVDEDYSIIIEEYKKFNKDCNIETENSYSINYNELHGRFDYDYYSPQNRKLIEIIKKNNAVRLGDVVQIVKTKSNKLTNKNLVVEYVELSDVNSHSLEIINSTEMPVYELPSRASFEIKKGDIITAIAGNSIGSRKHATALVGSDYDGAICANGFRVLRNCKINSYYLLYYIRSEYFLNQISMLRTGAAIPNISDIDFKNLLISIPNKTVMSAISEKVKRSFELREKSKIELNSIEYEMA
ncbi:MAG: hypothetical protein BalsKO_32510 [Balneolaceae bacterium]